MNETKTSQIDEVTVKCTKQSKAFYTKYYQSDTERKTLIADLGDAAFMLYDYYLRMASIGTKEITDGGAAEYFGWSLQKVKRNRLSLSRAGYYNAVKYKLSDGRRGIAYYVGLDAVQQSRPQRPPADSVAVGRAGSGI